MSVVTLVKSSRYGTKRRFNGSRLAQALELANLSPNVMIKVPGSKEGYEVLKFLTSRGISTNNTLTFVLPQ